MMRTRDADLDPNLVLRAYAAGLFPMSEGVDDPEVFWVDPELRGIFPLDGLKASRSLAKLVRSQRFCVRADQNFDAVIDACAEATPDRPTTWINGSIRRAFIALFEHGFAHSIEVYRDEHLVGGLYGVALGAAFFGESMFHRERDASKVALLHLVARLRAAGYQLLDTQFVTPHLASLGAVEISRDAYHQRLAGALRKNATFPHRPFSGDEVLGWIGGYLPAGSLPPNSLE